MLGTSTHKAGTTIVLTRNCSKKQKYKRHRIAKNSGKRTMKATQGAQKTKRTNTFFSNLILNYAPTKTE